MTEKKKPEAGKAKAATGKKAATARKKPARPAAARAANKPFNKKKGAPRVAADKARASARASAARKAEAEDPKPNPRRMPAASSRAAKAAPARGAARGSARGEAAAGAKPPSSVRGAAARAGAASAARKRSPAAAAAAVPAPVAGQVPGDSGPASPPPPPRLRWEGLPLVVIAGRPNVGKSTLYNRMLHKRRAITDPTPGVTRDPIDAECELRRAGQRIRLVDTGGFKMDREGLDGLVVEKSLASLERADLIVFLVDAVEVTPEDEEFASLLRRWSSKILLVVNKADSPERDDRAWGHLRWGFGKMVFVSAEHGRNMDELEEAIASRLDFSALRSVEVERAEIRLAILGKPNTGKSTLLNRLVGEERSIVSPVPGTTRDVVEARFAFKGRSFVVLDTAGIRRKGKVTQAIEYYSVTRAIRCVDDCDIVIHMIDAKEGLTDQDKKIAAFAAEKGRGIIFVLNKWDEMPDLKNSFEASRDKLRYFFGQMAYAPVLPLSAREGTGIDKLLNMAVSVYAQLTREVETSRLNRAVEGWIEATPPPVGPKTRWKLRYAVQTGSNPVSFAFFVTRPDVVADAYLSFLRNKIREDLEFDKVPVLLELKASHKDRRPAR